jgi:hypothetical protein
MSILGRLFRRYNGCATLLRIAHSATAVTSSSLNFHVRNVTNILRLNQSEDSKRVSFRISRNFASEIHQHFAELILFGAIAAVSVWPLISLAEALSVTSIK